MAASTRADKFRWWEDVRFGVFFHWGIYSSLARAEWVRYAERIPFKEYKKLTAKFRPKNNWAEEWMKFIKRAGAGYAVLTTKHHDGYCLFDTKTTTDYSAATTAPGRDLIAEYVEACRKHKIKVGLYYSPPDWRYYWNMEVSPRKTKKYEEYKEVILTHIEELCTGYGKIDLWWWDGTPPEVKKTVARMRRWQPEMMINDRCGLKLDCGSAEMALKPDPDPKHRWEVCLTSNNFWGYFGA